MLLRFPPKSIDVSLVSVVVEISRLRSLRGFERFYEKVVTVKADVAALLTFLVLCGFRHISTEKFALGSLGSDD